MLVLSRKQNEQIVINDNIVVTINRISGNRVSVGIQAPGNVDIVRGELRDAMNSFRDDTLQADATDDKNAAEVVPQAAFTFDAGEALTTLNRAK